MDFCPLFRGQEGATRRRASRGFGKLIGLTTVSCSIVPSLHPPCRLPPRLKSGQTEETPMLSLKSVLGIFGALFAGDGRTCVCFLARFRSNENTYRARAILSPHLSRACSIFISFLFSRKKCRDPARQIHAIATPSGRMIVR